MGEPSDEFEDEDVPHPIMMNEVSWLIGVAKRPLPWATTRFVSIILIGNGLPKKILYKNFRNFIISSDVIYNDVI